MTQDQVYVPRTRSQRGLPPFNSDGESLLGANIKNDIMKELHEAIGDSPIGAALHAGSILVRIVNSSKIAEMKFCFSSLACHCT